MSARRTEVFVSVYEVSRCYGGPEEGGWYFDRWEYTGESLVRRARVARAVAERLESTLEQPRRYGRGPELHCVVESRPGEHQTRERPRYE